MRIAFIVDHLAHANAGTEHQIFLLLPLLARRHEMELICLQSNDWLASQAEPLNTTIRFANVHGIRRPKTYVNFLRLAAHLRRGRFDIAHTFLPISNILGVAAARLAGVRGIVSSRRDFGEWMTPGYLRATRFVNRWTSGIVTNSEAVRDLTVSAEGYPLERITVVLNGIEVDQFLHRPPDLELLKSLNISPGSKVIGLVANMRPMKHQESFVRCAQRMLKSRPDLTFLFVGVDRAPGAPIARRLRALAEELGILHAIRFAQAEGDIVNFLSIIDVAVNCSQGEGLSNALMESMAFGIPCVASASGGNPDLVRHMQTGLLFPLDDAEQAAEAIGLVLSQPELAQTLSGNARRRLLEEMSTDSAARAFEQYYGSLVAGGRR